MPAAASVAALLLSRRSNLFLPYCIATLAPLLMLLVAHGLEQLRDHGQRLVAVAAAASMLGGYAALLGSLYQTQRSNAREVAQAVAKNADGSDLILIVHGWLSSSFNRYYTPATEQIDFPAPGRIGATPFDHVARRVGDPAALTAAERRLAASRAGGRRVWLVFDATSTLCVPATCTAAPVDPANGDDVAVLRASQLSAYVRSLYGAPTSCDTTSSLPPRDEEIGVCLFSPHGSRQ